MKCTNLLLLGALFLLPGCLPPRTLPPQSEDVEIKVFTDKQTDEAGILVQVTSPVSASGDKMGEVRITIVNHLEEEVFVEVTGFDRIGYEFGRLDAEGDETAWALHSNLVFPGNTYLLKRLQGAWRLNNRERVTCGCSVAFIEGRLDTRGIDLREWIGAEAKVSIPITGYLRKTGRRFSKRVDLPITITNGQQSPEGDALKAAPGK